MAENLILRKSIGEEELLTLLPQVENIDYWLALNPNSTICDQPFQGFSKLPAVKKEELDDYALQLREEGYFQTPEIIPTATIQEMQSCIEKREKGWFSANILPLLYDVFYQAFSHFDSIFTGILGANYKLIPNFWVYYIETNDNGKGFEPHRDAEYENTIEPDGMPTVITFWITITEATPLNSCMYIVPTNRDPQYADAIKNLKTKATEFALEDIRALPTKAGTISCWNQYIFHWGSRSSKRAKSPRISYAAYCQRGDIPPVDDRVIDIPSVLDFQTRLSLICRGLYRYSYVNFEQSNQASTILDFLKRHMAT